MKPSANIIIFLLALSLTSRAQTYTVSGNNQSWSSLVPSGTCTGCTINIPAGWTLLLSSNGTCNGCTFIGGTVNITSNFNFSNGSTVFKNDTLLINKATTFNNVSFDNDSVAVNFPLSSSNSTSTISHTRMQMNADVTFNSASFTNDSIHIANKTLKVNNSTADFTSTFIEVSGNGGSLNFNASSFTGSSIVLSDKSTLNTSNAFTSDGSSFTMHDGSTMKASSMTIKNNSSIVMDGTSNSLTSSNAMPISNSRVTMNGNSTIKASSITATGTTINASGGTITTDNALLFTGTTLTSTGAMSIKASSVTLETGSAMTLANGSNLKSDNAIKITSSSLTATGTTIKGSSFTAQTNSTVDISGASSLTSDNVITITSSILGVSGSTTMKGSSFTAETGSAVYMSGTSNLTTDNSISFKASSAKFFGDAWAKANGSVVLDNGSNMTIGDGAQAGTAHLITNNQLQVLGGSQLAVANGNNYLFTNANNYTDGSHSYPIKTNTISCGTGHPNSCTSGYVYGCATMNSSGALGCVTLALSVPELTTRLTDGQVLISWENPSGGNADRFIIQHSINNHDWFPISEITASPVSSSYSIKDTKAQTGNNYYRLQLVDKDGNTAWSPVSVVQLQAAMGEISLFPNPIRGRVFSLKTPFTDAILVKIYTLGGQLVLLKPLKGQTLYSIQLPASLGANSYILVQVIGNGRTQTFTVLTQ